MAERPRGRRQMAGGSGGRGRGRGRPRGRRGRQVHFGTGDGAGRAGRQEGDGVRRESGDGAERRVTVATRIDGEHGGGSATTQRRVRFTDRVDDSSEKVATATIADASKKKDTAKTEAADSTTTSTGVGAARTGDGEESNEWSTRSGDADSNDGPARRVVIDYSTVATVDGDKVCGGPSADELRKKVEAQLAAYVDAIEHPTQATRDAKGETDEDRSDDGERTPNAPNANNGSPASAMFEALTAELQARDEERGRVLRVEAQRRTSDETKQREADQLLRKRLKRLEHAKTRRKRRAERKRLVAELAKSGTATVVQSTREHASGAEAVGLEKGVTTEANVAMPEPNEAFRSALDWSARAAQALQEVRARQLELKDGFATLAVAESRRQEALAAGNVVGEGKMREGVAQQLVLAAAGLDAIGEKSWTAVDDTPLQRSRTRRRFEKRVRKAKAKEVREWQAALAELTQPARAYKAAEEVYWRYGAEAGRVLSREEAEEIGFTLPNATKVLRQRSRRQQDDTRKYVYHSGSVYAGARVESSGDQGRPRCIGQLRAVQAPVVDSLPTAVVRVHGERHRIKLDTGAQYSVAGEEWQQYGEKQHVLPPVDYVEGFTGAVSRVLGVWRFKFRTQYEQTMEVDALIVEGATGEFLLGESWMMKKGVKIDFVSCEMKWYEDDTKKIVPFQCSGSNERPGRAVKVRLARAARVQSWTCRNVELSGAAPEGTVGCSCPLDVWSHTCSWPRRCRRLTVAR
ncbi:hypothetical protein PF003_g8424 [Phytophthora fragariae]|nr:hypothetical protein PF003_g8424 [Phytophthora fragariae]